MRETPEAGFGLSCVRQPHGECLAKQTVIVARLDALSPRPLSANGSDTSGVPPLFVARYHNRDKNHHAEHVMMEDSKLLFAIRRLRQSLSVDDCADSTSRPTIGKTGVLSIFISLQPCHFSSSAPKVSCTTDLQRWYSAELSPRGIALDLVVAYPYRSHWQLEKMSHEEVLELGGRALWGPRFNSKGPRCSDLVCMLRIP